jgi:hypothetical protein
MSYGFRGGFSQEEVRSLFEGSRVDPATGHTVKPIALRRGVVLADPLTSIRLGLTVTARGDVLVWTDGTLAKQLRRKVGLCPVSDVINGEEAARAMADRLGVPLDACTATVRRSDLVVDVEFDRPCDGLAVLRAVAGIMLPFLANDTLHGRGTCAVETINFRGKRAETPGRDRIHLCVYDKSQKNGEGRGQLVRIESRWHPAAASQVTPNGFASLDLAARFAHPFRALNLEALVVAEPSAVHRLLSERRGWPLPRRSGHDRTLTEEIAESLTGAAIWLSAEGNDAYVSERSARHRRADFRKLGIEINSGIEHIVPLGDILTDAVNEWAT